MAKNKSTQLKKVLKSALKHNQRVPVFVISKTNRSFTRNPKKRYWRAKKLRINAGKH